MNLKSFHVFFISCAIALAFVLGVWALGSDALAETSRRLVAVGAFGSGLALIAYEAWFLRFSRRGG